MANVSTATWSATGALQPEYYRDRFLDSAAANPMVYPLVFKVSASDRNAEYHSSFAGFQNFTTKGQGVDISFQTPGEAYTQTFTHVTYAAGFSMTREAIEDGQYRELEQLADDLGAAAASLVETTAANIFNNGFDSNYTFGDAKELFATDHPLAITGGTEQNEPSSDADLSYASLEQGMIDMAATVDDAGKLSPYKPDLLMVAPSFRVAAQQILGSPYDGTDFQINTFNSSGMNLVVWDYLTDADAWFLLDNRHRNYFYWRRPLMFERWADEKSQVESYAGSMRFVCGPATWRGLYGNTGAA